MPDAPVFTFFVMLRAAPAWLALSRPARGGYVDEAVRPLFARYPAVSLRFFDAEAFSGRCSDMAMFQTADLRQYYFLIEALRDEAFFGLPYFEVLDIIPAVEDGYVDYERAAAAAA
ncbi:darcynin family protein [Phenylobacterium sp.]|uniref:darcynin family protein n=1 Tax=Phenylobacterium sp. TaxID=1871053 RepID=UPI0035B23253